MTTNKALEKIDKMIKDYKREHLYRESIVIPLWEFTKFESLTKQAIQEDRERIKQKLRERISDLRYRFPNKKNVDISDELAHTMEIIEDKE